MANLDYGRLLKILSLTASSNDGEALNALRAATKMLVEAKLSWEMLIRPGANPSYTPASPSYTEEILRKATEQARNRWAGAEAYARDFNTDDLRARQAERDMRYKAYEGDQTHYSESMGWTEKGPGDSYRAQVDETNDLHLDAEEMSNELADEQQRANYYVFAVVEPKLAKFLFDNRSSGFLPRILYRTVCETGDISEAQKVVLRQRIARSER